MPEIGRILGIRICVFSRDHLPPHFHAFYGEHEALIDIKIGTVVRGDLRVENCAMPCNTFLKTGMTYWTFFIN
ncbi:MAG: DUF4160 domain-containing protein [Saprospiraceae bacterium]